MATWQSVDEPTLRKWVAQYRGRRLAEGIPQEKLVFDATGIAEPPYLTYNDFTLGNWPDSIIASAHAHPERSDGPWSHCRVRIDLMPLPER